MTTTLLRDEGAIVDRVLATYALSPIGIHGVTHWARVYETGIRLAAITGADATVVRLFAILHDACRVSEGADPEHGARAAQLVHDIRSLLVLNDTQVEQLATACALHTHARGHDDITIATCFDADRLDLPRVGVTVDPARLATAGAAGLIDWATECARTGFCPIHVATTWHLQPEQTFVTPEHRALADSLMNPPGYKTVARHFPAYGPNVLMHHGIADELVLAKLFGYATPAAMCRALSAWDGAGALHLWFHGTTEAAAHAIMAEGFDVSRSGWRWSGMEPFGKATFVGGPEYAFAYGPWMVAAMLTESPAEWDDPRCIAAFAAAGVPRIMHLAAQVSPEQRATLSRLMCAYGVHAVRRPVMYGAEVLIYDPACVTPFMARPGRAMIQVLRERGTLPQQV